MDTRRMWEVTPLTQAQEREDPLQYGHRLQPPRERDVRGREIDLHGDPRAERAEPRFGHSRPGSARGSKSAPFSPRSSLSGNPLKCGDAVPERTISTA